MSRLAVLFWKECLEVRWLAYAGLLIFLLPVVNEAIWLPTYVEHGLSLDRVHEFVTLYASVLAMLVAVILTCSDLRSGLHAFWVSRPIGLAQSLVVKWSVGLAVVIIVCALALSAEVLMSWAMLNRPNNLRHAILNCLTFAFVYGPTVVLIYSLSFLIGCLFRRTVHAAVFALAALLLVYFAPLLIPMLSWLSVAERAWAFDALVVRRTGGWGFGHALARMLTSGHGWFLAAMFGGSVLATVLAWVVLARDWRLRLDVKLLCWTLGGVAMLLFAATARQVGSNLQCERIVPLNDLQRAVYCVGMDGQRGMAAMYEITDPSRIERAYNLYLRRLDMTQQNAAAPGEVFTSHGRMPGHPFATPGQVGFVWSADRPDYVHFIHEKIVSDRPGHSGRRTELSLCTARFDEGGSARQVHQLDLMPVVPDYEKHQILHLILERETIFLMGPRRKPVAGRPRAYHILGWQAVVIDVSDPAEPKVKRVAELPDLGRSHSGWGGDAGGGFRVGLPDLPEMSHGRRLEWAVRHSRYRLSAIEGNLLVAAEHGVLITYRLGKLTDTTAEFTRIGLRRNTPLERLLGAYPKQMLMRDGLVYVLHLSDGGLTAFDVRDPARPRRVGHYAAPDDRLKAIAQLPDGRTLVAGRSLHVVAPPRID